MKKAELVYFKGCASVPAAREALKRAGISFTEVVQDDLESTDPRRKLCSPTLLIDGKPHLGGEVTAEACSLDRWDSSETAARLRELDSGAKSIGCCVGKDHDEIPQPLSARQRVARALAGMAFVAAAYVSVRLWPLALILAWFGISHLVAAVTRYAGCPELGAIPSAVLGRNVSTVCGPWRSIDRCLGLR